MSERKNPALSYELMRVVADVFGLKDRMVSRLILDLNVHDVARLYVEEYADGSAIERLAAELPKLSLPAVWSAIEVPAGVKPGSRTGEAKVVVGPEQGAKVGVRYIHRPDDAKRQHCETLIRLLENPTPEGSRLREQVLDLLYNDSTLRSDDVA